MFIYFIIYLESKVPQNSHHNNSPDLVKLWSPKSISLFDYSNGR